MYCPYCGAKVPEDVVFCPKCGQKQEKSGEVTTVMNQRGNAFGNTWQTGPATKRKSSSEFMEEYLQKNKYYDFKKIKIKCAVFGVILLILPFIFMWLVNSSWKFSYSADRDALNVIMIIAVILGAVSLIISAICQVMSTKIMTHAETAYREYQYQTGSNKGTSLFSDSAHRPLGGKMPSNPKEWICPRCGRVNAIYVGTCACGQRKP